MFVSGSLALLLSAGIQLTQAVHVYLSPPRPFFRSSLSPEDASNALSRHLGLEAFESFRDTSDLTHGEENFVGQGSKNVLVMTIEESDASAVLPDSLQHAFTLAIPPATPISSLSSIISTYNHHASQAFASVFSTLEFGQQDDVASLASFFESTEGPSFASIELSKLHEIGKSRGPSSKEYTQVVHDLRALLEQYIHDGRFTIAILTFTTPSSASLVKRQIPQQTQAPLPSDIPAPHLPIGGISTCFESLDVCSNVTSTCSGKGQCVAASKAGRTCFVCSCGVTKTGEGSNVKTDHWAGERCERKDISGPFVLLTSTVVVIILLIIGSVSLLYSVGDSPLPSTLMATAVTTRRD